MGVGGGEFGLLAGLPVTDWEAGRTGKSHSWLPAGRRERGRLRHNTAPSLRSRRRYSHLLRSAGSRHAPQYFDSQKAPNPATDQLTIAPRHPQTSVPNPAAIDATITAGKTTGLPITGWFLHQDIPHLSVRPATEFRCSEKSSPRGKEATSVWRTHLLKAN